MNNDKILHQLPFSEAELKELINIMPYGLARIVLAIYYFDGKGGCKNIITMYEEWQKFFEESNHSVDTFVLYSEIMNNVCEYYKGIIKYDYNIIRYAKCKAIEFVIGLEGIGTFKSRIENVLIALFAHKRMTKKV